MRNSRYWIGSALAFTSLLLAGVAAACGSGGETAAEPEIAEPEPSPVTTVVTSAPTPTADPTPTPAPTETSLSEPARPIGVGSGAPELEGISGWINSEPFTLESQRGKVVLIDFWTYTCVNCIRTLPYLREWHEKYHEAGLTVVGVHTPEFEFEKLHANVVEAAETFGLEYAIAQDNDYVTWIAFENRAWPAKYLIDKNGTIRYVHFGEGAYDETEREIRKLLDEAGANLVDIALNTDPGPEIADGAWSQDPSKTTTRELYAGFQRNYGALRSGRVPPYVLHREYYNAQNADIIYRDPGEHQNNYIYLHGSWRNEPQRLVHARETEDYEDYVAIRFYGTSVNVVMAPQTAEAYSVRITVDGGPVPLEQAGVDVMFDDDGNSFVLVSKPRMYGLMSMPALESYELRLSSNSPEFSLFAFTFGAYEGGEPGL